MLTLIPGYDMIITLGRSEKECPFFCPRIQDGPSGLPARASRLVGGIMTPPYRAFSFAEHKKEAAPQPDPTYHIPITNAVRPVWPRAPARRK